MGDAWTLHLGDCLAPDGLASLADGSVDHVICDPPYSEHVHGNARRGYKGITDGISRRAELGFEAISEEQMAGVMAQAGRLARRWVLVFCDLEIVHRWRSAAEASGLEHVRVCAWIREGGTPQFSGDRPAPAFEAIEVCHRPGRKQWNGGGTRGAWAASVVRGGVHTTQKPLALMEKLVRLFTDPGDLVLDPFAGSGTTGVAAIRHGRRFIGWERDPKYHAVAVKRLSAAREQLRMFEGVAGAAATPPTASPPAPIPAAPPVVRQTRSPAGQGAPIRRVRVELDGVEVET